MAKRIIIYIFLLLFCLASLCSAQDITLKWEANTEPDLVGYKIYYKQNFSGAPYNGIDIDQGVSPIEIVIDIAYYIPGDNHYMDPDNPEFLLTGLDYDNYDYYLVVTAFDNEEPVNESGYSNEVNTIDDPIETPPEDNDSDGGCFISVCASIF
jgi:hypothetical protein